MAGIYDNEDFFSAYAGMARSREGLAGAGEWHQLREPAALRRARGAL